MTRISRRQLLQSGAAASFLAASCIGASAQPRAGGILRLATAGSVLPRLAGFPANPPGARLGAGMIFNTLTEVLPDGRLQPELATDWDASADGRNWSFRLRDDVTFHDGTPLTASHAVSSIVPWKNLLGHETRVWAADRHRVRVVLEEGNAGLPFLLADHRFAVRLDVGQTLVGTGPYRFDGLTGGLVRLRRASDTSWGPKRGWVDGFDLHLAGEGRNALDDLLNGSIDAVEGLAARHPPRSSRLSVSTIPGDGQLVLACRGPAAGELASALKCAIDRPALVETWLGIHGRPGADVPFALVDRAARSTAVFDPDRARGILRSAGIDRVGIELGPEIVKRDGTDRLLKYLWKAAADVGLALATTDSMRADGPRVVLGLHGLPVTTEAAMAEFPRDGLAAPERYEMLLGEARRGGSSALRDEVLAAMQAMVARESTTLVPAICDHVVTHCARLVVPNQTTRIAEQWHFT